MIKHVNLITDDFLAKYGTRVISHQISVDSPTDTVTEKVRTITIPTTAQDVGVHTITFKATDNAGHKANDVTLRSKLHHVITKNQSLRLAEFV